MKSKKASILIWGIVIIIFILIFFGAYFLLNSEKGINFSQEKCEKYDEQITSQQGTLDLKSYKFICLKGKEITLKNEILFNISQSQLKLINEKDNEMRVKVGINPYNLIQENLALKCGLKYHEESLSYQNPYDSFQIRYKTNIFSGVKLKSILNKIIPESFNIENNQNYTISSKTIINGEEVKIEQCANYFNDQSKILGMGLD